jgi:hypothetical protein
MLRTTQTGAPAGLRVSPRLLLLAVLPALVVLAAMAPASAMAGTNEGEGSSGPCTATVTSTQDPAVASISVDCGDGNPIEIVDLQTTEDGLLEDEPGTNCSNEESARNFTCEPSEPPESLLTFRFRGDSEDICADPRLTIDFEVRLEDGSTENIDNVVAGNCSDDSGGGDDEDDGATPEGGVDSGTGRTAPPAAIGPALPIAGATLLLALVSAGLFLRKTRTTP